MALSTLNPVRLVSFGFKAPAPSIALRTAAATSQPVRTAAPRAVEPAASAPYRVEPMLLLHQEQAETMRLVAAYVSRAIQVLRKRP